MKKLLCFIGLFLALFALKSHAGIPGGTIPFIFDSHLYLQVRLNDTIPVTVIYDTGADFLYLDEDYLKLNNLQNAFGKKGIARMEVQVTTSPNPSTSSSNLLKYTVEN